MFKYGWRAYQIHGNVYIKTDGKIKNVRTFMKRPEIRVPVTDYGYE